MKGKFGLGSFCSESRVYAALEPPEGGTPNYKMTHYLKFLELFIQIRRLSVSI